MPAVTEQFYPLRAIVCGFEKSGTTLLNEIMRRHPDLDSGFEGGFLLGDTPREFRNFQPYYAYFRETWELTRADMKYICDTDEWGECYSRARERSPVIENKQAWIFDKTPKYMEQLAAVLGRVPGIPCVVNVRDPRALMLSWANWSGFRHDPDSWLNDNFEQNCQRFLSYAAAYTEAEKQFTQRILLNQFEELCIEPELSLGRIFDFIGLEFNVNYLSFSSKHFVYGNEVSTDYLYPYRGTLSERLCQRILDATEGYSSWHFHG